MRRFYVNRWMALVLTLAVTVFSLCSIPRTALAGVQYGESGEEDLIPESWGGQTGGGGGGTYTPPPGSGSVGDPDMPQTGFKQSSARGAAYRLSSSRTLRTEGDGRVAGVDWMTRYSWALQALFRAYLRY